MSGSWTIDGLMIFFLAATLGAAAAPLLLLPKWLERAQARRIAFHGSAIAALTAELERPQADPRHVDRLAAVRQFNVVALQALAPREVVAPLKYDQGIRIAA